ncbi:MAG TPA: bacterial proteasome activator family protein [Nocardioides sp.]|nr:bacterial proteasome activator family protein [Nocardioides sp.]
MTEEQPEKPDDSRAAETEARRVVIVGPDGQPVAAVPASARPRPEGTEAGERDDSDESDLTSLVEQPAKVMRIGSMIRQLLEEVKSAPLDDASRQRLMQIHRRSIKELETGLAPELVEELERLTLPFTGDETPSDAELRISQAQLVGWLEGLFHGIQTAIYAQQMAARAQFEQIRRALPPGVQIATGQPGHPGADGQPAQGEPETGPGSGGMYL